MALTRDFRITIAERVRRDSRFRNGLFVEALNAYLEGETAVGKSILRDLINATIGFEQLAVETDLPSKSLHRMLSSRGNPSTESFFSIVNALQRRIGLKLRVTTRTA
jgi:DNA-binding phage protein